MPQEHIQAALKTKQCRGYIKLIIYTWQCQIIHLVMVMINTPSNYDKAT